MSRSNTVVLVKTSSYHWVESAGGPPQSAIDTLKRRDNVHTDRQVSAGLPQREAVSCEAPDPGGGGGHSWGRNLSTEMTSGSERG